jgi:hypothetical protein
MKSGKKCTKTRSWKCGDTAQGKSLAFYALQTRIRSFG